MTDTIQIMELKYADKLTPDQLMVDDIIKVNGEIVQVIKIDSDSTGDIYSISYEDEFGDKDIAEFNYTDSIAFYVYIDDDK
jgi:hypothetical protein